MTLKQKLAFVSTRFLFPADSGGKIRTTQILRGLKGGASRVRLLMPCHTVLWKHFATEIESVCDEFVYLEQEEDHELLKHIKK